MILHITSQAEWLAAQQSGEYSPPSLQSEGFIHCSTENQVLHVANAFYGGRSDLLLLQLDEQKLTAPLKWEPPAGMPAPGILDSDQFPHLFGALNLTAVSATFPFLPDSASGKFSLPSALSTSPNSL